MPSKERILSKRKFINCRMSKVKCSPEVRDWPAEKCLRCIKSGEACSPNMTAREAREGTHQVSSRRQARSNDLANSSPLTSERQSEPEETLLRDLSPLMSAVFLNNIQVVEILLRAGADPNESYEPAGTCLELAAYSGYQAVLDILLRFGANVNAVGTIYRSALHAASAHNQVEIVEILLQHGAAVTGNGRVTHDLDERSASSDPVEANQNFDNVGIGPSGRENQVSVSQDGEPFETESPDSLISASTRAADSPAGTLTTKYPRVPQNLSSSNHVMINNQIALSGAVISATGTSSRLPTADVTSDQDSAFGTSSPQIDGHPRRHDVEDYNKSLNALRPQYDQQKYRRAGPDLKFLERRLADVEYCLRAELLKASSVDTNRDKGTVSVSSDLTSTESQEQGSSRRLTVLEHLSQSQDSLNNHSELYHSTFQRNELPLSSEDCPSTMNHLDTPPRVKASTTKKSRLSNPKLNIDSLQTTSLRCNFSECTGLSFSTFDSLRLTRISCHVRNTHYCAAERCIRSRGRNGFSNVNEMRLHFTVHTVTGWRCPFCEQETNLFTSPIDLMLHITINHHKQFMDYEEYLFLEALYEELDECFKATLGSRT